LAVAKFTLAAVTPFVWLITRSNLAAQSAQSNPSSSNRLVSCPVESGGKIASSPEQLQSSELLTASFLQQQQES
jgi:hypothetical protein